MDAWFSNETCSTHHGYRFRENCTYFSEQLISTSSTVGVGWGLGSNSQTHSGIWSGLGLHRSYECRYNCSKFIRTAAQLCPEDRFPAVIPCLWFLHLLHPLPLRSLGVGGCGYALSLRLIDYSTVSDCVNHSTAKGRVRAHMHIHTERENGVTP